MKKDKRCNSFAVRIYAGKEIYLGSFKTENAAREAYASARKLVDAGFIPTTQSNAQRPEPVGANNRRFK